MFVLFGAQDSKTSRARSTTCQYLVRLSLGASGNGPDPTAIPLPIKLYVALRVGVAVILSQRPTPGTIEYSTKRFCGETYVLAGVLKSQVFKLCFGAKSFVPGKKLAKLRKEEDWQSQPAPTVGPTAPTVGPMQVSVHREIFNFSWRVAKSVLSSTVRR